MTNVMGDNMVEVELVDIATKSKLVMDQLRQASPDILKEEVMDVFCCLGQEGCQGEVGAQDVKFVG